MISDPIAAVNILTGESSLRLHLSRAHSLHNKVRTTASGLPGIRYCSILTGMSPYRTPRSLRIILPAWILLSALGLSSCATRIPVAPPADPTAALPGESSVYLRADRKMLLEAASALLSPADLKTARPFLARTARLTASIIFPTDRTVQSGTGAGVSGDTHLFGIAEGSYPAGAASLRLRLSRDWRREERTLVRRDGKLRIAFSGKSFLVAGTSGLDPLLDRLAFPGSNPLPEEVRRDWEASVALWAPRPGELSERFWSDQPFEVPARGLLLTLNPSTAESGYSGAWIFVFDSERDARVYAPICRLVHLAFIRAVYQSGAGATAALDRTAWTIEGNLIRASGFPVSAPEALKALASKLP